MDPDSLSANASALSRENSRLRTRLDSQELDIAKLRADFQRQFELNEFLQEDNEHLKSELRRVEQQFVTFEQRLRAQETKASAVAATAETQLLFDKLSSDKSSPLDSLTVNEVESWLATADEMVRKKKYAAAVYYAKRAMRSLNQADRRQTLALVDGDTRIIIVSIANLREGPGSNHSVIAKLSYGTVIVQTKVDNDWSEVRTQAGETGWIHNSLIR
jgi:acyl-CoA thioesterase FadM